MIQNLTAVTGQALRDQVAFLSQSAVPWAAKRITSGQAILLAGRITTPATLGDLRSIFRDLDGMHASTETGCEQFFVKEVRAVLLDERCADVRSKTRLQEIEDLLAGGKMLPNITIEGDMVVDGNKTAAAYYHRHRDDAEIDLHVFVLAPKSLSTDTKS